MSNDNITHDLETTETGYDIARDIEKLAHNKLIKPMTWDVHSANPVGRKNIETAMKSVERFWRK